MKPACHEVGGVKTSRRPVAVHTALARHHQLIKERLRRFSWQGLWLIAQHSMYLLLAAIASTDKTGSDAHVRR